MTVYEGVTNNNFLLENISIQLNMKGEVMWKEVEGRILFS